MHLDLLILFGWSLILGVSLLAWRLGGRVERQVALLVVVMSLAITLIGLIPDKTIQKPSYFLVDGLFGAGLLVMAMRYTTAWLGVAVLLQAAQFSLHAYYLVAGKLYDTFYAMVNNLVSLGVLLCLAVGCLLAWRKRRRVAAK
ncbi:hypothetical protein [Caulobacter sp. UNC279MFTsu5.1]|uniref:hypothetical protein n=1 Tax=Caulobacter sp. UNC279MFTsu5.1 TaxID=1502775 RepID=UPI0008E86E83|nr:hypothetical protein [Caulobacter sp. UNC279MFTsu5.1]SFK53192.1 hypothetical protein SAMN02799626_04529 [Caulobacter sp. UNC279MFTsu5.1]